MTYEPPVFSKHVIRSIELNDIIMQFKIHLYIY